MDRPVFQWRERIEDGAAALLADWWHSGLIVPAAAVETADGGDWLLTHAEARADGALWFPGEMLTGVDDICAGPVWASSAREVYPSWLRAQAPMPFHQAHGHSTALAWDRGLWWAETWVRPSLTVHADLGHIVFRAGGRSIVGIDPGHGVSPAPVYAPLVLADGVVRV
ncbi:hypothetical protein [Brevibacterium sp.]|uniref:hypothetical protein n=1 Tax=Brevibacterium sp. TaxID=1701 RepID=UPI0025C23ACE|nr:hypothetical protein [Brevibacterium sp.]